MRASGGDYAPGMELGVPVATVDDETEAEFVCGLLRSAGSSAATGPRTRRTRLENFGGGPREIPSPGDRSGGGAGAARRCECRAHGYGLPSRLLAGEAQAVCDHVREDPAAVMAAEPSAEAPPIRVGLDELWLWTSHPLAWPRPFHPPFHTAVLAAMVTMP